MMVGDNVRWPEHRWERHNPSVQRSGGPEPTREAKDGEAPYEPSGHPFGFAMPVKESEEVEPLLWEGSAE